MRSLPVPALVVLVTLSVACGVTVAPGTGWAGVTLTADGDDTLVVAGDRAFTTISAPPTNRGTNTRIGLYDPAGATRVDQDVCATWVGSTAGTGVQQGLLLRWDGTRGITVTKNVSYGFVWVIDVHEWDLTRPDGAGRYAGIGQASLPALADGSGVRPLPWRACASARGAVVRFKIWPLARPEPADGDPCCTGSAVTALTGSGRPGWYGGHIPAGHTIAYTDLATG